jgi:hypothetical protein
MAAWHRWAADCMVRARERARVASLCWAESGNPAHGRARARRLGSCGKALGEADETKVY